MEDKFIDLKDIDPHKMGTNFSILNGKIHIILLKGPMIALYNLTDCIIEQKWLDEKVEEHYNCALFYKNMIVAGCERGLIKIINLKYGTVDILRRHGGSINQLTLIKNYLYSISDDSSVIKWDLDEMVEVNKFIANQDLGLAIDVSNCGKLIACGGSDNTVRIFDGGQFPIFQSNEIFPSAIEKVFFYGNFLCIKAQNNIVSVIRPFYSKHLYKWKESQMILISQFKNKVIYDFIVDDKIYFACENKICSGYVYKNELLHEYPCKFKTIRQILKIKNSIVILGQGNIEIIKI